MSRNTNVVVCARGLLDFFLQKKKNRNPTDQALGPHQPAVVAPRYRSLPALAAARHHRCQNHHQGTTCTKEGRHSPTAAYSLTSSYRCSNGLSPLGRHEHGPRTKWPGLPRARARHRPDPRARVGMNSQHASPTRAWPASTTGTAPAR
jgi:hypothetical protein